MEQDPGLYQSGKQPVSMLDDLPIFDHLTHFSFGAAPPTNPVDQDLSFPSPLQGYPEMHATASTRPDATMAKVFPGTVMYGFDMPWDMGFGMDSCSFNDNVVESSSVLAGF
jgi:hypothetical protein